MDNYKIYASEQFVEEKLKESQADMSQNDENAAGYIKNRTHWVETETVEILPEQNVTGEEQNGMYLVSDSNVFVLSKDKKYTVMLNGKTYECVAETIHVGSNDNETVIVGNKDMLNGILEDINMPFLLACVEKNTGGIGNNIAWFADFGETITLAIYEEQEIVKKLDEKFLPDIGSSLMRVIVTQDDNGDWIADKTYQEISEAILNEETPYVVINDRVLYLQQSPIISEISTFFGITPSHIFTSIDIDNYLYHVSIYENNNINVDDSILLSSKQYVNEQISTIKDGETLESFKDVETALATKAEIEHVHEIADVTNLQTTLDGKMNQTDPTGTGSFSMNRKSETDVGLHSVTTGYNNTASGKYSEAHGFNTTSTNEGSFAEGHGTTASGYASHSEGLSTQALGGYSHAEGYQTIADAMAAHTEGVGTKAVGSYQHIQGKYNLTNSTYAHIIGNGEDDNNRSNAHTVKWDGTAWFAGEVKIGGTGQDDAEAKTLATIEYVDSLIGSVLTASY